ncbi:hypothetical protein RRG08_024479 [Elysia crispata]|uniref:Uncharacterized protein n=1 Tax=Elysia crispata TaxID=231223 RepID=A0AAE0YP87_9GAST|nr:hypothetical protein RRG08_024479 [Elysia crispata]
MPWRVFTSSLALDSPWGSSSAKPMRVSFKTTQSPKFLFVSPAILEGPGKDRPGRDLRQNKNTNCCGCRQSYGAALSPTDSQLLSIELMCSRDSNQCEQVLVLDPSLHVQLPDATSPRLWATDFKLCSLIYLQGSRVVGWYPVADVDQGKQPQTCDTRPGGKTEAARELSWQADCFAWRLRGNDNSG